MYTHRLRVARAIAQATSSSKIISFSFSCRRVPVFSRRFFFLASTHALAFPLLMYLVLFFTNLHRTNVLKIIIYQFFIYSVRLVKLFFVAATEESPHS